MGKGAAGGRWLETAAGTQHQGTFLKEPYPKEVKGREGTGNATPKKPRGKKKSTHSEGMQQKGGKPYKSGPVRVGTKKRKHDGGNPKRGCRCPETACKEFSSPAGKTLNKRTLPEKKSLGVGGTARAKSWLFLDPVKPYVSNIEKKGGGGGKHDRSWKTPKLAFISQIGIGPFWNLMGGKGQWKRAHRDGGKTRTTCFCAASKNPKRSCKKKTHQIQPRKKLQEES